MSGPRRTVDLNCDMGESFGAWTMGADEAVMPLVSSANIACGFHGGDSSVMRRTVALAKAANVAIGAHVSLADLQGFGRREMNITPDEAYELTLYQVGALGGFARAAGTKLVHVKPHGALYNMAAGDDALALAIACAVRDYDPALILFGLAGSRLIAAGHTTGLRVANEVFADRAYERDGKLSSRRLPGAVLHNVDAVARRAVAFVTKGAVVARTGETVHVKADTICLHGDGPDPAGFAQAIRAALEEAGVTIASPRQRADAASNEDDGARGASELPGDPTAGSKRGDGRSVRGKRTRRNPASNEPDGGGKQK